MPNKFIPPQTDSVARSAATPLDGEVFYDTDEKKLYYGDGTTVGGLVIGSGGHTIEEEGTPLTQRAKLNFVGDSITVTDDAGNDRTIVTVNVPSGGRELLTANRTYYVRTDGSDSNNGLTDTAGGAFLTIQKAIDVVASLDISIREVTIQVADGTYAGFIFKPLLGSGTCTISGNTGNTSLCIINSSISGSGVFGNWSLMGFRLTTVTGNCITCHNNFFLNISNIDFSTSGDRHLLITSDAIVRVGGNYSISGSPAGGNHILCEFGGKYICQGRTVTLTGTPAFSATFGFVFCHWSGLCDFVNSTFSGSATGRYYLVEKGGYIRGTVNGNLPGNVAGTVTSPGFYST